MADLEITPRGPGFAIGGGEYEGSQAATLADDVARGDFVLVLSAVDYVAAGNPTGAACPIVDVDAWTEVAYAATGGSGSQNMQVRAWLGQVTAAPTTPASRTVTVTQTGTSGQTVFARAYYGGSGNAVISRDGGASVTSDTTSPYTHASATASGTHDLLVIFYAAIRFIGTAPSLAGPSGMDGWGTNAGSGSYHNAHVATEHRTTSGATGTRNHTDTTGGSTVSFSGVGTRFLLRSQGEPDPTGPPPGQFMPFFGR